MVVVGLLVMGLRETTATDPPKERIQLTLKPFDHRFRLYLLALVAFTVVPASQRGGHTGTRSVSATTFGAYFSRWPPSRCGTK
jgi:hypothetical protein